MRNGFGAALLTGLLAVCVAPLAAAAPHDEAEAQAIAATALARIAVPPGAVAQASEPAGDGGELSEPAQGTPATPDLVDLPSWWTAGGTMTAARAYLAGHPPPGYRTAGSGPLLSRYGVVQSEYVSFQGPPGSASLAVGVAPLAGGGVGLRADAQVIWTLPRPPGEVVPRGARRMILRFSDGVNGARPRTRTIRSRAAIARLTTLLNALPPMQPGVFHCAVDLGERVRVSFYGTSPREPLAVATVDPEGCGAVGLRLSGVAQPTLAEGPRLAPELRKLGLLPGRRATG